MKTIKVKTTVEGAQIPTKAFANDGAFDCVCPKDTHINMPWKKFGRGFIDLGFITEMPSDLSCTPQSRSGYTAKGLEATVLFWKDDKIVGQLSHCRVDADVKLGLVDSQYRNNWGALYQVNSDKYMPTSKSQFVWLEDEATESTHVTFVVKAGTRICQIMFHQNIDVTMNDSEEIDMQNNRGGGFGHTNK